MLHVVGMCDVLVLLLQVLQSCVSVGKRVKINIFCHSGDRKPACIQKTFFPNWNAFGSSEGTFGTVTGQRNLHFHGAFDKNV